MTLRAFFAATAGLLSLAAIHVASASPEDRKPAGDTEPAVIARLTEVEAALRQVRSVQTNFTQEKHLAMMARPLILEGRIAIESGKRLLWEVFRPVHHVMLFADDRLVLWDEDADQVRTVRPDANPALQGMVAQLRAWLSGRLGQLAADCTVQIRQDSPLTFAFVPRPGSSMAKLLAEITITVSDDQRRLLAIEMLEQGGDRAVIRFHDTVLDQAIPAVRWQVPPVRPPPADDRKEEKS